MPSITVSTKAEEAMTPKQTGGQSGHLLQRVHIQVPDHFSPHFPIWALEGNTPALLPCPAQGPSPDPPRLHRRGLCQALFYCLRAVPPLGENPGLSRFSQGSPLAHQLRAHSWSGQGGSASVSREWGEGMVSHQCPCSLPTGPPSPRPSSPPACTCPSAKASLTWA